MSGILALAPQRALMIAQDGAKDVCQVAPVHSLAHLATGRRSACVCRAYTRNGSMAVRTRRASSYGSVA